MLTKKHIPTLKLNRHLDESSGGEIYALWKKEKPKPEEKKPEEKKPEEKKK